VLLTSHFSEIMKFHRYELLQKCFQINSAYKPQEPSYEKIKYLMKKFQDVKNIYKPSSKLALDELISPFRGRFKYLTYNKEKPTKWGIRIIAVADSITGYCLELIPCFGNETYERHKSSNLDELVVSIMAENGLVDCDLYMDNYYCHPNLISRLLTGGINTTGTYRLNRKDVPKLIKDAKVVKEKKKVQKDELKTKTKRVKLNNESKNIRYFKSQNMFAVKWKDKREVNILTTKHSLKLEARTTARNRKVTKPIVIYEYNKYMRGVDKLNQRIHYIK